MNMQTYLVRTTLKDPKVFHLIALAIFASLTAISMIQYLLDDSFYVYRDVSVTQPDATLEKGISAFDLESARRMLHLLPFYGVTKLMGLSALQIQKATFLTTGIMIGYFAYYACYKFLSDHAGKRTSSIFPTFVASLVFGFFYMYNPRAAAGSLGETGWGLTFSYSLVPLIFYYFDKSINENRFRHMFYCAFLAALAVAGTQQFLAYLPIFLFVPWLVLSGIRRRGGKGCMLLLRNAALVFVLWLGISSYWIVITLATILEGVTPQPGYLLTYQMLDTFSSGNELENVIRLMGTWWPYVNLTPILDSSFWTFLTFVPLIALVLTIAFLKDAKLRFISASMTIISLVVMFFNKGTQDPLPNIYPLLYGIPMFGWMFRVPSHTGIFLPFFMGMVIAIGIYSVLSWGRRHILISGAKFILPAFLIFSVSIVAWPSFRGDVGGTFKQNADSAPIQLGEQMPNISLYNGYLSAGNQTQMQILRDLQSKGVDSPPIVPADYNLNMLRALPEGPSNAIVLQDPSELFYQFLTPDSIKIRPFSATKNHLPSEMWSVAGTDDPLHGPFHEYLTKFGLSNNDSDFHEGLVFTWSTDALQVPVAIQNPGNYSMFIRYLESVKGGTLGISLGEEAPSFINTKGTANRFVWDHVASYKLTPGKYSLALTNDGSLNAVNLLVLVPDKSIPKIQNSIDDYSTKHRIVYSMRLPQFSQNPLASNSLGFIQNPDSLNQHIEFSKDPLATHMSLQFGITKQTPRDPAILTLNNLRISPVYNRTILASNFENVADVNQWRNESSSILRSIDSTSPIAGLQSLHVKIPQGSNPNWQILSSTKHAIPQNSSIDYSISAYALNTSGLHGKLIYYDENNAALDKWDLAFTLKDPETPQIFAKTITPPPEAKFFTMQIWCKQNPNSPSDYWIDNVSITRNISDILSNQNLVFEKSDASYPVTPFYGSTTSEIRIASGNENSKVITSPVPINGNGTFDLGLSVSSQNIKSLSITAVYYHYPSASSGAQNELVLDGLSPVSTNLKLPLNSTSTIAVEIGSCENCSWLQLDAFSSSKTVELATAFDGPKWVYFHMPVNSTESTLRLLSGGKMTINQILIYGDEKGNPVEDLLDSSQTSPHLLEYKKLTSTKYEIVVNSTRPFMLLMENPFDKSWVAYTDQKQYHSLITYPQINGFFIGDSGILKITLEYGLQKWFFLGSIISIATIATSFTLFESGKRRVGEILSQHVAGSLHHVYSKEARKWRSGQGI